MAPRSSSADPSDRGDWLGRAIDEGRDEAPDLEPEVSAEVHAFALLLDSEAAARQGRPEVALTRLEQAVAAIDSLPASGRVRLLCEARLELVLGRRALRGGAIKDVSAHARRALSRLGRNLEHVPITLRLAALELQAITAIMSGAYDRAMRTLDGATDVAHLAGDPWVARIHRLLGAIHARRGRPLLAANAYQLAASRLLDEEAPLDVAKLSSNLAMVSLMAGQLSGARAAVERALRLRLEHRAPIAELANSTAVLALIAEREGSPEAVAHWERAVALTRQGPDTVLTAEIELRAAIAATERGDHAAAEALLARALERTTAVGRSEPTVVAMAAEATARLRLADGGAESARTSAKEALSAYGSIDAVYHVARMELLLARIERHLDNEPAARKRIATACALALRGRFELAWREADLSALGWAAELGDTQARRYCRAFRVDLGAEVEVLILDHNGAIEAFGQMHELGPTSVPFRLARALVTAAPKGISAAALCRKLWRTDGFDPRTANRLKVHVHRLRELLGPERACVLTDVASVRGATKTSYRWNSSVAVRVISGDAGARGRRA